MAANWKRSDELVWEELGSEMLLVSPRSGGRWSLNAKAAAIWKLCDGSRSLRDLAAALARASGQSLSAARREIAAFCQALQHIGLLSLAPSAAIQSQGIAQFAGLPNVAPLFRVMGLTGGGRRRPTPRGNSGPG